MAGFIGAYGSIIHPNRMLENSHSEPEDTGIFWWQGYLVCTGEDEDTLVVEHDRLDRRAVILREDFKLLGIPAFHVGDEVTVRNNGRHATVVNVTYHFKREKFFYTIDYGDRQSTNWFFDEDLEGNESE